MKYIYDLLIGPLLICLLASPSKDILLISYMMNGGMRMAKSAFSRIHGHIILLASPQVHCTRATNLTYVARLIH